MSASLSAAIWQLPQRPVLGSGEPPARADVVVVGAGLAGLSCAYRILKEHPEKTVLVLEAGELGGGASGRTTGMVTPGIGQDFAGMMKRLGKEQATHLYRQTLAAVRKVGELIRDENIECEFDAAGQLVIAHGDDGEARLERQARAMEACGLPLLRLSSEVLATRVKLGTGAGRYKSRALAALYFVDAAMLNPVKLLHGLANAARKRGAKIVCNARVVAVTHGMHPAVKLESGQVIPAGVVVLATASESMGLAKLSGRIIPISLKVIATQPLSPAQLARIGWQGRECIIDSRRLFNYFRLTSDQRIVLGGGSPSYGAPAGVSPAFSDLVQELKETFPGGEDFGIARQWCGTIDYTLDGLPMIGPLQHGQDSVIYVGGFCGHGVALSMLAGEWVAAMVARASPTRALPAFRHRAPLIPGEWLRKTCFSIACGWMRFRGG